MATSGDFTGRSGSTQWVEHLAEEFGVVDDHGDPPPGARRDPAGADRDDRVRLLVAPPSPAVGAPSRGWQPHPHQPAPMEEP